MSAAIENPTISVNWGDGATQVPRGNAAMTPTPHVIDSDRHTGNLPVARGGTGADNANTTRLNLGAVARFNIDARLNVSDPTESNITPLGRTQSNIVGIPNRDEENGVLTLFRDFDNFGQLAISTNTNARPVVRSGSNPWRELAWVDDIPAPPVIGILPSTFAEGSHAAAVPRPGGTTAFLRGDGAWATPPNTLPPAEISTAEANDNTQSAGRLVTGRRLNDAITNRVPAWARAANPPAQLTAGNGITVASNAISVTRGTAANQTRHGNDAAYTDNRTPTPHAIDSDRHTGNLPVGRITGLAGASLIARPPTILGQPLLGEGQSVSIGRGLRYDDNAFTSGIHEVRVNFVTGFGSGANEVVEGNDQRLTNARTPTSHAAANDKFGVANGMTRGHFRGHVGGVTATTTANLTRVVSGVLNQVDAAIIEQELLQKLEYTRT